MKTKNNTGKKWIISSFLLVLIIIAGLFIFSQPQQETAYYYDGEVGFVKTVVSERSKLGNILRPFQQSVVFTPDEIELGDIVTIQDDYYIPTFGVLGPDEYIAYFEVIADGQNLGYGTYSRPYGPGEHVYATITFTPTEIKTYNVYTTYFIFKGSGCVPTAGLTNWDLCTLGTDCLYNDGLCYIDTPGINTLTVTAVSVENCVWSDWSFYESITNGYIEIRTEDEGPVGCIEGDIEYRTFCDTGYQIVGTDGNSGGSGQLTCEIIPIIPECTADDDCLAQICESEVCVNFECNADVISTCSDGITNYITQTCDNNRLNPTGNTEENSCPAVLSCDINNLDLCTDESLCEGIGKYWYNDICNPEQIIGDACNSTNLDDCLTETDCVAVGGYWYNDICNLDEEYIPECTEEKCEGEDYFTCESGTYVAQGKIDGECGYIASTNTCTIEDEETCEGEILYVCELGQLINKGKVEGKCGYIAVSETTIEECTTNSCCVDKGFDYYNYDYAECRNLEDATVTSTAADTDEINWTLIIILSVTGLIVFIVAIILIKKRRDNKKK